MEPLAGSLYISIRLVHWQWVNCCRLMEVGGLFGAGRNTIAGVNDIALFEECEVDGWNDANCVLTENRISLDSGLSATTWISPSSLLGNNGTMNTHTESVMVCSWKTWPKKLCLIQMYWSDDTRINGPIRPWLDFPISMFTSRPQRNSKHPDNPWSHGHARKFFRQTHFG